MESSSLFVRVCSFPVCSFSGNNIGRAGARALAESLKQNTTLTNLNLSCMSELGNHSLQLRDGIKLTICACLLIPCSFSVNNIGGKGASALAESLKQNTTLTNLNLEGMSELACSCVMESSSKYVRVCSFSVHFQLIISAARVRGP